MNISRFSFVYSAGFGCVGVKVVRGTVFAGSWLVPFAPLWPLRPFTACSSPIIGAMFLQDVPSNSELFENAAVSNVRE